MVLPGLPHGRQKARPTRPGNCPHGADVDLGEAGRGGGRAALWGGLQRDTAARMLVDDDESGSDYDKEHDQGHFDGGGPPCEPPHTAPAEPYDARGRPAVRQ